MAADLPENYVTQPDAFQFIRDVPTDWETSRTLQGEIGDYVVVARQQRGGRRLVSRHHHRRERAHARRSPLDFLERRQTLRGADLS